MVSSTPEAAPQTLETEPCFGRYHYFFAAFCDQYPGLQVRENTLEITYSFVNVSYSLNENALQAPYLNFEHCFAKGILYLGFVEGVIFLGKYPFHNLPS